MLSFHPLLVGGNPFATTSIYTLIAYLEREWGVHFPVGGTGSLVRGLLDLIDGLGGRASPERGRGRDRRGGRGRPAVCD